MRWTKVERTRSIERLRNDVEALDTFGVNAGIMGIETVVSDQKNRHFGAQFRVSGEVEGLFDDIYR